MRIALDENGKLMARYQKLEAALKNSQEANKAMKSKCDEQILEAEKRVKLA